MNSRSPISRRAHFINTADLVRSTPRQSFASDQAKRAMGTGNPLAGKDNRKPASTVCPYCGRWHRPGTVCHNMRKADFDPIALFKGKIITTKPKSGNPYRDADSGQFASKEGQGSGGGGWSAVAEAAQAQQKTTKPSDAQSSLDKLKGIASKLKEKAPKDYQSTQEPQAEEPTWLPLGGDRKAAREQAAAVAKESAGKKPLSQHEGVSAKLKDIQQNLVDRPHAVQAHELATVLAPGVDPNAVMSQMTPEELQAFGNAVETGQEIAVPDRLAPFFAAYNQAPSGFDTGQAIGAQSDVPAGTINPTISGLQQAPSLLSQAPPPASPPDPMDQQKQLTESSQHLQGQDLSYLDRLRRWLAGNVG